MIRINRGLGAPFTAMLPGVTRTPPDGVSPTTLTRPATAKEISRYYTDGWRGGDQGAGSPCRIGYGLVSQGCTNKADGLGFFQPSVEMSKTTSGKWNSTELAAVRAGTKDFGRRGDGQAWRVFFKDKNTLRYEYKPRDYGDGFVGQITSPGTWFANNALAPVAQAGGDLVKKLANFVCGVAGNKPAQQYVQMAADQYGRQYGQDAAARAANGQMSATETDAYVRAVGNIACQLASTSGGSNSQITQSQLVAYFHKSKKTWYTWSISGGGSLSGARICGVGQLCGPLAGVTLSELNSRASAIGAQFVGETPNIPAGARNAGEIDDAWYQTWWGIGLMLAGAGGLGYLGYKKFVK